MAVAHGTRTNRVAAWIDLAKLSKRGAATAMVPGSVGLAGLRHRRIRLV